MGMYAYVKCELPLPDLGLSDEEGQTHEFEGLEDCSTLLTITAEGRLTYDLWHYVEVPKAERPYPDAPDDSWKSVCGSMRKVVDRVVDMDYHGLFHWCHPTDATHNEHRDFVAKFTDGRLVSIAEDAEGGPRVTLAEAAQALGAEVRNLGGGLVEIDVGSLGEALERRQQGA